jgi:hypothetical protein
METANQKTLELLNSVKRSKKFSFDHIDALLSDYDRLGRERFGQIVKAVVETAEKRPTVPKDASLKKLESLQKRSGLSSKQFVDLILVRGDAIRLPKLSKKNQTQPKILAHFRAHSSEELLFKLATEVAKENTHDR